MLCGPLAGAQSTEKKKKKKMLNVEFNCVTAWHSNILTSVLCVGFPGAMVISQTNALQTFDADFLEFIV